MQRDTLFQQRRGEEPFRFDHQVATVFSDMIRRSVPGYPLTLEMIAVIAGHFARDGSVMYDLGCSLGESAQALCTGAVGRKCRVIAVDNSREMIARCRQRLAAATGSVPVQLVCADITDLRVDNASVVALNFTLQFIPRPQRLALLKAIHRGMNHGAALLISEKITFEDEATAATLATLHAGFKRRQGYSELEISRKREALEEVLMPDTMEQHRMRLQQAGFTQVIPWFQCLNFVSLLAIR